MKSLREIIEDPKVSKSVVADGLRVLDEEMAKRSGLGGLAIKGAYKVVKNVQGGKTLEKAVEILIPEFIDKLAPYYGRFQEEGKGKTWTEYLQPHYGAIADELLSVTDQRVQGTGSPSQGQPCKGPPCPAESCDQQQQDDPGLRR